MADEPVQKNPPEATTATRPPPQVPEPVSEPEPALASVAPDLQKEANEHPVDPPPPEPELLATAASQPLAAALEIPQEFESPAADPKETVEPDSEKKLTAKLKAPESFASFKEESNKVSDLSLPELKSLQDLKLLVQEGLNDGTLVSPPATTTSADLADEISIWGVPLLTDYRSDVILLKFLRARDFKVKESLTMLKNTLKWRRDFNVDELVNEDLGDDLEKVVFMQGLDKEGHQVCYNVYGEFQNKELYARMFGDEEKRKKFLRWRIQFLERSIRKLDFSPGGINTIFQISDLKNSPGLGKKELRAATNQAMQTLQDNYPEFVAKQVFINVPWWYLAYYTMMSSFLTQRTKSKFVFTGPTKTSETLFKYISPEQVPTQYGGLSVDFCECNPEFTVDDPVMEINVKPSTKQIVEIIVNEKCTLVWELRVVGWEVSYGAEYIPNVEHGYTVIIHKTRKMLPTDEPVVSSSFNVSELGNILLTIDNPTSKKKKLLYRYKVMPFVV